MSNLNTLNARLLMVLGLPEDSANLVVDRIAELERENAKLREENQRLTQEIAELPQRITAEMDRRGL